MLFWDWLILGSYFLGVLLMGAWLARKQKSTQDYFLGGKTMPPLLLGISLAANQVSAVSLVSAPAFVAIRPGGGLGWLQYELAVPLAMVGIILLFGPLYPRLASASLYEFAERRFGRSMRQALSLVFLFSRALATGISLYATALVLSVATGAPLGVVYIVVGLFAVAYTTLGGIRADVYSDAMQFVVLWLGTLLATAVAWGLLDNGWTLLRQVDPARVASLDFGHHGLGDGKTFSFWPMLFGGFFLYMSYYGCDQSQAQRLMSAQNVSGVRRSLLVNGVLRFPLVMTYCIFGVILAAFVRQQPAFLAQIPAERPDYLVPLFLVNYMPVGIRGLVVAGLFAAAMSSIDSALNSLSAITLEDFLLGPQDSGAWSGVRGRLRLSRILTLFWGVFCLGSGAVLARSSRTIIELVNMIGSAFYGPVLAVFVCGVLCRRVRQAGMLLGLVVGVGANLCLWLAAPGVSWLWWNPAGFLCATLLARIASLGPERRIGAECPGGAGDSASEAAVWSSWSRLSREAFAGSRGTILLLLAYFLFILGITFAIGAVLEDRPS